MSNKASTRAVRDPDQVPLTAMQAERLAAASGLQIKELAGATHAELSDRLKWRIDPLWWRFQRVCGRVVKVDPVTGVTYGVPNATVHVEDTDCNLLLFAPAKSPYVWFYPFRCRREVIATVRTDACGNFCVWIPRWEIDWILRWRRERICFPVIFDRPRIPELIERGPFPPIPRPEPGPFNVPRLRAASLQFGDLIGAATESPNEFDEELAPPLPREFTAIVTPDRPNDRPNLDPQDLVRANIASQIGLNPKLLAELDLRRPIGPFRRCVDVFVPQWAPIIDVPDITFRVTQDVNGDGTEETIYGENYFQVRWNDTSIGNVVLKARSYARESRVCAAPPKVPCGNVPAINFAGLMPLTGGYHDNATGYATRPNRPRPQGVPPTPATAPYCQNVNLFGCLPAIPKAAKYRLVYKYAPSSSSPFSAAIPFTTHQWYWHPLGGSPIPAIPSPATGWFDLPPAGLAGTPEENFLFPFDTTQHEPGIYAVSVEIGDAGGVVLASSAEVKFWCDNRAPSIVNQIRYSLNGGGSWDVLPTDCPVVRRGTTPVEVLFEVTWSIMAPAHYRDSSIGASGCGPSGPAPTLAPSGQTVSDWHSGALDNAMTYVVTYSIPATHAQGTYGFGAYAGSRAFNPSGSNAGYQTNDWLFDVPTPPVYSIGNRNFSLINA